MVNVKIEDQKDKDGNVIGQYATFDKIVKTEVTTFNKTEVEMLDQGKVEEKIGVLNYRIRADQANEETQPLSLALRTKKSDPRGRLNKTIRVQENTEYDHLNDLRFEQNQKNILVHLVLEESKNINKFPNSFTADILTQESQQLEMIFYVPLVLFETNRNKIQVNVSQDQTMTV